MTERCPDDPSAPWPRLLTEQKSKNHQRRGLRLWCGPNGELNATTPRYGMLRLGCGPTSSSASSRADSARPAARPLDILLQLMNNPMSITSTESTADPRMHALGRVALALTELGHRVYPTMTAYHALRTRFALADDPSRMGGLEWLQTWLEAQECAPPLSNRPDLLIVWSNWEHDQLGVVKTFYTTSSLAKQRSLPFFVLGMNDPHHYPKVNNSPQYTYVIRRACRFV